MADQPTHIVITGDLNEAAKPAERRAERWNLHTTQTPTRKNRKLDVVITDMRIKHEQTFSFANSDHRALVTTLESSHDLHLKRRTIPRRSKILKDLKNGKLHLRKPEMFREPFRRILRFEHFRISKPKLFIPPEELTTLHGEELIAFHKKFQIDGWARLLGDTVEAYKNNDSKMFH